MSRFSLADLIHKDDPPGTPDMAKPPGLRRRGASWEMRVRVPARLHGPLPTEIVKSFGGVSTSEAYHLGWLERARIAQRIADAEERLGTQQPAAGVSPSTALTPQQLTEFARAFLGDLETRAFPMPLDYDGQRQLYEAVVEEATHVGHPDAAEDTMVQRVADHFARQQGLQLTRDNRFAFYEAIREGWLEHLGRQQARLDGATVATLNPAFEGVSAHADHSALLTVGDLITAYIDAPERSANTGSTQKMDRSRLGLFANIVGSERLANSVTRADIRRYAATLLKVPAHLNQRYPGISLEEAIALAGRSNAPTLSPTSIKRDIQAVKSFFKWIEKEDYIATNPTLHLSAPRAPKRSSRRPFRSDELRLLLKATQVIEGESASWPYWLVRITMLHGFRLTEPLGLRVADLVRLEGEWTFRLRPNAYRSLKTEETARDVPVHPKLLELGITKLLDGRDPNDLLISDAPQGSGKAFNAAQKRMARIIRSSVSDDPDLVFHSLRHSFRDAMRDIGCPTSVEQRLGGWKTTTSDVMDGYGRGHQLPVLRSWIAKIDYPDVVID